MQTREHDGTDEVAVARSAAWLGWAASLAMPGLLMVSAAAVFGVGSSAERMGVAMVFTVLSVAWLLLGVPGAMVLRSHVVRAQLAGERIPATRYLKGMGTIWGAASIGGVLAGLAAALGGGVMPGFVPWLLSALVTLAFVPAKAGMTPDARGA